MGAPEKSQANANSMQRVKVYRLNDDGKWDDQGTGHVVVDYLERSEDLGLIVFDEDDNDALLLHRIHAEDIYRKQEDTIISWRDPEYGTELALSFQETSGCSYIWDHICNVQRNMHFNTINSEPFHSINSELRELPAVELSTLPVILKTVVDSGITDQLRLIDLILSDAIPIKDPFVLSKIHQTYRVGFLKDVVLARVLDEPTNANLNSIIHGNNAIVVSLLKDDSTFIQELFTRLKLPSTSPESKKNLVYFLHEFCSLSKSLQMVQQLRLFRDLMNEGVFDVITEVLQSQDKKLMLIGTDILILFLNQDPNLLRSYVVRQEGITLLGLLVKGMITDFGDNMHCQFLEILRSLLDSCTLTGPQRDTVIDIFFEKHLGQLVEVVAESCPPESTVDASSRLIGPRRRAQCQNVTKPEILSNICELLCFCVLHHPYRIKCNFLLNNVIEKILLLTRRRERYLVVGAVRFVRTILSRHDEHLINYFVRNNVLKPIVDAFVANGNRYNLLHSAVLELFGYIRKENMKLLLKYIIDSFWDKLVKFENLACIHSLRVKYEQCLDNSGTKDAANAVDLRRRTDERALEKEEEHYFNEDSDEEDAASASIPHNKQKKRQPSLSNGVASSYSQSSPRLGGLVDYDDDDDDEDYRPPPKKQKEASEDDEEMEFLRLKKNPPSKDKEPEHAKKQKSFKNTKSKDGVFAALCSTLSQAVLPGNKTTNNVCTGGATSEVRINSGQDNQGEGANVSTSRSDNNNSKEAAEDNRVEKETAASRIFSDRLHGTTSDNRQLGGEECPLVPPKSSPEMAVNGS
ncbi:hypothetical protein PIB30_023794 [Stylosanthes scabra]|uniref:Serine/threonine-protein phosphatase 4 regulatory subunit 3-like central domain-containing protein n=1 Tax=Stylosanthes scabra TaxID=79078 RepID=A0ABU6YA02_9FABA|nr:hypothetical protein [Stylosanthes scabra]